jgi:hypothetical protein
MFTYIILKEATLEGQDVRAKLTLSVSLYIYIYIYIRVSVPGHRYRGPVSIPGATRFSEK